MRKCMFFRTAIYCTLLYTVTLMLYVLPVVSYTCLHSSMYVCCSCLVVCTNTHTIHLQLDDFFNGCYELCGHLYSSVECVVCIYTHSKLSLFTLTYIHTILYIIYILTCQLLLSLYFLQMYVLLQLQNI